MMNASAKGISFLPNIHIIYLCVPSLSFLSIVPEKRPDWQDEIASAVCPTGDGTVGQKDGPDDIYSFLLPSLTMITSVRRGEIVEENYEKGDWMRCVGLRLFLR